MKVKIIKQALFLFFKYGIKSVSMDDLARELGISKKTLYQFVENKGDLIKEMIYLHVEEEQKIIAQIEANSKDAIDEMLGIARYIMDMLKQFSPSLIYDMKKYYHESWSIVENLQYKSVYATILKNLVRGVEEGLYRNNFDKEIVAKLYVSKSFCIVDEDIFPSEQYAKKNLFRECILYHLNGIISEQGAIALKNYLNTEIF